MDKIYATLAEIERREGYKFDLLICCGDYEVETDKRSIFFYRLNALMTPGDNAYEAIFP